MPHEASLGTISFLSRLHQYIYTCISLNSWTSFTGTRCAAIVHSKAFMRRWDSFQAWCFVVDICLYYTRSHLFVGIEILDKFHLESLTVAEFMAFYHRYLFSKLNLCILTDRQGGRYNGLGMPSKEHRQKDLLSSMLYQIGGRVGRAYSLSHVYQALSHVRIQLHIFWGVFNYLCLHSKNWFSCMKSDLHQHTCWVSGISNECHKGPARQMYTFLVPSSHCFNSCEEVVQINSIFKDGFSSLAYKLRVTNLLSNLRGLYQHTFQ